MRNDNSKKIRINPLVFDFYRMAEEYEGVDSEEINPSLNDLAQVTQRYQSHVLIAEGGMKRIYNVYDARAKRHLALAMLREDSPEDLYDPFIHEAWLTARLDHPNIITIHDIGVNKNRLPYFTMDLKQGVTLRELIEKLHAGDRKTLAQYPLETLLQIFLKICDAVSYAHSVNVVHLDLKPANIQVGDYGRVLVCDWGLGRVLSGDDPKELDRMLFNPDLLGSSNLYGQFKGTPGYMAPEQLTEDAAVDVRTDVYGLGCILYTLLTLLRPLTGDDEEIIKHTKNGAIMPPSARAPERHVPAALNAVVMKALATDPAKRYASVNALRTEVHRYLTGFATNAENAGVFKQFSLFYRRNRRFCSTILCSLFIITTGAVWAFHKLSDKERIATEAREQAERTLSLYEAGRTELDKVNSENVESIVMLAERYSLNGNKAWAKAVLEKALESHPNDEVLCRAMGVFFFCNQQFDKALPWLERGIHPNDPVCKLARHYAGIKPADTLMSVEDLIQCLRGLGKRETTALMMVVFDQKNRFDMAERAKIIKAYLQLVNPGWHDGWFDYDLNGNSLRLGGPGLKKISTQRSVLAGLSLRSLDLSGSEVEQMWPENQLGVERLDVRGTPMSEVVFLQNIVSLRELIVTPGQFSSSELGKLPKQIRVLEQPYP